MSTVAIADAYRKVVVTTGTGSGGVPGTTVSQEVGGELNIDAGFGISLVTDVANNKVTIVNTGNGTGALTTITDNNNSGTYYPIFTRSPPGTQTFTVGSSDFTQGDIVNGVAEVRITGSTNSVSGVSATLRAALVGMIQDETFSLIRVSNGASLNFTATGPATYSTINGYWTIPVTAAPIVTDTFVSITIATGAGELNPITGTYQMDTMYLDQTTTPLTYNPNTGLMTVNNLSVASHVTLEGVTSTGATGTGKLVFDTGPAITEITTLGIRDTTAAYDVRVVATSTSATLTANRTLTLDMGDAARTVQLNGNLTLGGTFSINNNFTVAGPYEATITAAGVFNATFPAGTYTLPANNQTFYIGTTALTIDRTSAAQSLTGITSIDGNAATVTDGVYTTGSYSDPSWLTISQTKVGLSNVTNESKATMFTDPTFTGTVSGVTATHVGLGNVTNESKATMFTNSTLTGTTNISTLNLTNALGTAYGGTGATSSNGALTNLLPAGAISGYVLKTGGAGSYYWAAETGASTIVGTSISTSRVEYTATASQTVFTGTGTYIVGAGQLRVYIDGVRQFPAAYSETSTTSFTLSAGVPVGTKVLAEVDGYIDNTVVASAVTFSPVGNVSATDVQAAIAEVDSEKAPLDSPAFTGTPTGITATHVGLGNVTNESKATMFTSPAFTGTPTGITATHVGLGNVTNESKATMFNNPTFTGTVAGVTATMVGLGNVTNESKSTMFTSPSFSSPSISSGSLTFSDSTTQSTANRWVSISSGSLASGSASGSIALTDGTIAYGQYSKIEIVGHFSMTSSFSGSNAAVTLQTYDGSNSNHSWRYHNTTAGSGALNGASYDAPSYTIIYNSGSMTYLNGWPTLRLKWIFYFPTTTFNTMYFDADLLTTNAAQGIVHSTTSGYFIPGVTLNSSSIIKPYVLCSSGSMYGSWEVWGMKK